MTEHKCDRCESTNDIRHVYIEYMDMARYFRTLGCDETNTEYECDLCRACVAEVVATMKARPAPRDAK